MYSTGPDRSPKPLALGTWAAVILIALALIAVACGTQAASSASADVATADVSRLALGTLRLETTDQAVNDSLAAELLPLWQLLAELDSNSAAAPQEAAAVVEQIEATMTAEQVLAIDEMDLSGSEVAVASSSDSSSGTSAGAVQGAGPMMGGLPPDGGAGMPPGDAVLGVPRSASSGAAGGAADSTVSHSGGSLTLIEQVITLLESRAAQ